MRVAIPVETEQALDSRRAEQFGQAPGFVVAELDGSRLVGGGLYDSISHDEFGCAGIAEYVACALEADAVLVKQISGDALSWLAAHDVPVYRDLDSASAAEALARHIGGRTEPVR